MFGREVRIGLVVTVLVGLIFLAFWPRAPSVQVAIPAAEAKPASLPRKTTSRGEADRDLPPKGRPSAPGAVENFDDLKRRAKAGDAVAQRLLADTYESCFIVNIDREGFLKGMEVFKGMMSDPAQTAALDQTAQERYLRCASVDDGAIIPLALISGWYAQAAENGDLAARLKDNAQNRKKLDAAESTRLIEEVLASNDPAAVFAMGSTVGSNYHGSPGDPAETLMTGDQASQAWQVAACRMGYDCGASSVLMGNVCLGMGGCTGEDYETYVRRVLPGDLERRDLERRVTNILRLIEGQ